MNTANNPNQPPDLSQMTRLKTGRITQINCQQTLRAFASPDRGQRFQRAMAHAQGCANCKKHIPADAIEN